MLGGAIYFECPNLYNCKLDLSEGNSYISNKALSSGGAIYWSDIEPIIKYPD